LAAVSTFETTEFETALERLTASGLINRHGIPPDASYSFKHALVQDAAYMTMPKSRRRQLHARIGKVLTEHFPEIAKGRAEVVAQHFTEAGLASEALNFG
jgi:predicted ATPase